MTTAESTRHGHHNGYFIDGCRCVECKAGAAAYQKALRAKRRGMTPEDAHGTRHAYAHYGCRCEACKAANAAYQKEFRSRPGKKARADEASARWASANRDRYLQRRRTYMQHYEHLKKLRRKNLEVRLVTERDWQRLCARHGNCCFYCGEAKPLTMDHIIPIARGGRHSIGNLIPACRNCNAQKRTRLIVEWRFIKSQAA